MFLKIVTFIKVTKQHFQQLLPYTIFSNNTAILIKLDSEP